MAKPSFVLNLIEACASDDSNLGGVVIDDGVGQDVVVGIADDGHRHRDSDDVEMEVIEEESPHKPPAEYPQLDGDEVAGPISSMAVTPRMLFPDDCITNTTDAGELTSLTSSDVIEPEPEVLTDVRSPELGQVAGAREDPNVAKPLPSGPVDDGRRDADADLGMLVDEALEESPIGSSSSEIGLDFPAVDEREKAVVAGEPVDEGLLKAEVEWIIKEDNPFKLGNTPLPVKVSTLPSFIKDPSLRCQIARLAEASVGDLLLRVGFEVRQLGDGLYVRTPARKRGPNGQAGSPDSTQDPDQLDEDSKADCLLSSPGGQQGRHASQKEPEVTKHLGEEVDVPETEDRKSKEEPEVVKRQDEHKAVEASKCSTVLISLPSPDAFENSHFANLLEESSDAAIQFVYNLKK